MLVSEISVSKLSYYAVCNLFQEDIPGLGPNQDDLLKEDLIKGTDDFQERRAQAIATKALEIEKVWRTPP